MLCTMSAAREIGLDIADVPLHLYGPPGLAEFIKYDISPLQSHCICPGSGLLEECFIKFQAQRSGLQC